MRNWIAGALALALGPGCTGGSAVVRPTPPPREPEVSAPPPDAAVATVASSEGDAGASPAAVEPATPDPVATSLALGEWHACAALCERAVGCGGRSREGQLGRGASTTPPFDATPTVIPGGPSAVTLVAAGTFHACAGVESGRVFCWGDNRTGQSGSERVPTLARPTEVPGVTSARELTAGRDHTCALLADGTVQCWGNNEHGQLGDGTVRVPFAPMAVAGLRGALGVAAGSGHTCALLDGGGVRCWGLNRRGEVGDGTRLTRRRPTPVVGVSRATQIAVGREHGCALLADHTVRCWGRNDVGQLGNGAARDAMASVAVRGLSGATQIAAGGLHTCALLEDRTVRCWGSNHHGQLGLGAVGGVRREPTAVPGLTDVVALRLSRGADDGASCALRSDHAVHCWGDNSFGQLGRTTRGPDATPSPVLWGAPSGSR